MLTFKQGEWAGPYHCHIGTYKKNTHTQNKEIQQQNSSYFNKSIIQIFMNIHILNNILLRFTSMRNCPVGVIEDRN
jgi:hypothetical protein